VRIDGELMEIWPNEVCDRIDKEKEEKEIEEERIEE